MHAGKPTREAMDNGPPNGDNKQKPRAWRGAPSARRASTPEGRWTSAVAACRQLNEREHNFCALLQPGGGEVV
jgi:hypothetical protein